MTTKPRSPGNTAISVSLDQRLVDLIDARRKTLGLSRSQYLRLLAQKDLADRGDITVAEAPEAYHTAQPSPLNSFQLAQSAATEKAAAESVLNSPTPAPKQTTAAPDENKFSPAPDVPPAS